MTRTLRAIALCFLLLAVVGPSLVFLPPFRAPIDADDTPLPPGDALHALPQRPAGEGDIYMPYIGRTPVRGPTEGQPPEGEQPELPSASVSDLAAASAQEVVCLTWTAPLGDGPLSGATRYEIRYATSAIDEGNWDQAQRVDDPPYPAPPRGKEALSIEGLQVGQTYHFALRAVDASGDLGPISNDASTTVASRQGNGLNNGSFEDGLGGWSASGDASTSSDAHDGGSSARLANANIEQSFATRSGTEYKVTAWVKIAEQSGDTWGGFRAEVLSGGASLAHSGYLTASSYGNDWFQIALRFRAAGDSSRLVIGHFGDGTMVAQVDDVRAFEKGPNVAPVFSYRLEPANLTALPGDQGYVVEAHDPDGAVAQVYWDFGDGTRALRSSGSRRVSNAGTHVATVRVVDDEGLSVTRSVEWQAEDSSWPRLNVDTPARLSALSESDSYTLRGTAGSSIRRVRVSSDRGYSGVADGTTSWSATVPLQPGNNRILVQAHGENGRIATSERIVRYAPPGDLAVTDLRESPPSVGRWEMLEATFRIVNSAATHTQFPYDLSPPAGLEWIDGITVEGLFTNDNWQTVYRRPAFLNQRYERALKDGQEWLYPTGDPVWTVRFAPPAEGNWSYCIEVLEAKGSARSAERTFTVGGPAQALNHGPIDVSSNDERYFEYADGTPFLGSGHGVAFSAERYSYDAAELFERMGDGNQELLRWWIGGHLWASAWQPWNSTTLGHDGYIPATGLTLNRGYANGLAALRLNADNPIMFQGWESSHASLIPGRTYRLRVRWRTEEVTGPADGSQPYGVTAKLVGWPEPGKTGSEPALISHVSGDTPWHVAEGEFVADGDTLGNLALILENTTGGSAYIDEVGLYEVQDGGTLGPQLLRGPAFNSHLTFDPRRAAGMDAILAEAQARGKYLKLVISEKNEYLLNRIAPGGVPDAKGGHFADGEGTPSCRLHDYYWRYLMARFGAYRSVHSWELVNEHDPNNLAFFRLANHLASQAKEDGNPHLASTSTWASLAEGSWKSSAAGDISYADFHAYVHGTGWIEPKEELSNDSARLFAEYDRDVASKGLGKPVIWGEMGIDGTEGTDHQDPLLARDEEGVWLHKITWARTGPGGVYPLYWYPDHIYDKSLHGIYGAWNRFMAGIPLTNGRYLDAKATTSHGDLRVLGQKDTEEGRAHLWIDNRRHTWRAVVDGASIPSVSGSVTISIGRPDQRYTLTWYDTRSGEPTDSQTITADGAGNVVIGVSDLRTDTAVRLERS
jgi:hypothetical protein